MKIITYRFIDIIIQTIVILISVYFLFTKGWSGLYLFFVMMSIVQTASLLFYILSKGVVISPLRKKIHVLMYIMFAVVFFQIVVMQLSVKAGHYFIWPVIILSGISMVLYYINSWIDYFREFRKLS
jgi:hypothetical protein